MTDPTFTSSKSDLASQAKEMARDLRDKAAGLTDDVKLTAKDQAAQLGDAAKDLAANAADKVQSKMQQAAAEQKSAGADYIGAIAHATERAAGEFDNALPPAARYMRQASEQIQDIADVMRQRDVRELVGEVENFARRQPALFFGGAMILGFAALRFLKSSAPSVQSEFEQNSCSDDRTFDQRRSG